MDFSEEKKCEALTFDLIVVDLIFMILEGRKWSVKLLKWKRPNPQKYKVPKSVRKKDWFRKTMKAIFVKFLSFSMAYFVPNSRSLDKFIQGVKTYGSSRRVLEKHHLTMPRRTASWQGFQSRLGSHSGLYHRSRFHIQCPDWREFRPAIQERLGLD